MSLHSTLWFTIYKQIILQKIPALFSWLTACCFPEGMFFAYDIPIFYFPILPSDAILKPVIFQQKRGIFPHEYTRYT